MLRRSPIRRKRDKPRRGPLRDEGYRAFLRENGTCAICQMVDARGNAWTRGHCDPAHTTHNGMASKGDDSTCAPLCRVHHDQFDGHAKLPDGTVGRKAFEKFYGIDLRVIAAQWWELYQLVRPADKQEES